MLVLTRKENETIRIGNDIEITLVRVRGGSVRIGIQAPRDIKVLRSELEPTAVEDLNETIAIEIQDAYENVPARSSRRRNLPMATNIHPIRSEKVSQIKPLDPVTGAIQTVSA